MLLRVMSGLSALDAAAVAGHYGSISIVTFVAATSVLESQGIMYDGYMVAVAAAMEAPAILSALWLVTRSKGGGKMEAGLWREIMLNGSIVLLIGSFIIGMITGEEGLKEVPVPAGYGNHRGTRSAQRAWRLGRRCLGVWHHHACPWQLVRSWCRCPAWTAAWLSSVANGAKRVGLLYRCPRRDARRAARGEPFCLSHPFFGCDLSVQLDPWHSAVPRACLCRDWRLI